MENTLELLQSNDINKLRVEEIVEVSSISKKTFYAYFRDKYDVVCAIYDKYFDYWWGCNDVRQNLQGYIERASNTWENDTRYVRFIKNCAAYDGQNNLNEHIVQKGIWGIKRLLKWIQHEELITKENLEIIEFWMRGLNSMSASKKSYLDIHSNFKEIGIEMYKLFPEDLLKAVSIIPYLPYDEM